MRNKRYLIIAKTVSNAILCGSAIWAIAKANHIRHPISLSLNVYLMRCGITEIVSNICAPLENKADDTKWQNQIARYNCSDSIFEYGNVNCIRIFLYFRAY